MEPIAHR